MANVFKYFIGKIVDPNFQYFCWEILDMLCSYNLTFFSELEKVRKEDKHINKSSAQEARDHFTQGWSNPL